jgi:hypothetical protein
MLLAGTIFALQAASQLCYLHQTLKDAGPGALRERGGTIVASPVPVRVKLAALWATLMSLYIYNDYFQLYRPGAIAKMSAGQMGPLGPATDILLIAVSVMLAIPALMIALSVVMPPAVSRWLNVGFALVYTGIGILTFRGGYLAYQIMVSLEIATTLLILGFALRWPRDT